MPSLAVLKGVFLGFPLVAIVFTLIRVGLRVHQRKFWWDDTVAAVAGVTASLMAASTWIHYSDPQEYTKTVKLAAYYLIAEAFYITLWLARLSVLYSILRIAPLSPLRRSLEIVKIVFILVLVFLLAQVFWVCENQHGWHDMPTPQCHMGTQIAASQLVADIGSDVLLIVVPFRLFLSTRLPWPLKMRFVVIFGAALLTSVVSGVHAAYLIQKKGVPSIVSAVVEGSVSLIVCNLIVIIPFIFRVFRLSSEDSPDVAERTFTLSLRFARPPPSKPASGSGSSASTYRLDTVAECTEGESRSADDLDADPDASKGEFEEAHKPDVHALEVV